MERIEIPGDATYTPVALTDVLLAAPLASRILLGATLPGEQQFHPGLVEALEIDPYRPDETRGVRGRHTRILRLPGL
jgi:hypothetical protein